ncbi:hypothetical protein SAMN03097699_0955 [Flavobacteriaceae bacterium MAR_2010_188]|nr:hypothetical protein SAMN03097699_0955 [Flavobacteriaceae bacterium MAR_2010_188]
MLQLLNLIYIQISTDAPKPGDSGKLDLNNGFDLYVIVIGPIIMLGLYLLYKRQKRKDKEK